jgi:hypothetical protein
MERSGVVDLETAERQINLFIEKRAAEREVANREEESWKEPTRRRRARMRRENRAAWFSHYSSLADSLRASADHYEAKAQALLEDGNETERSNT